MTTKKINELIKLNDELENYFRNTIIPQLFVDADLRLRKFTPPAMKQFNFSQEDLGKSLEDLNDNIRYSTIVENVTMVIDSGEIYEKEIQTSDFNWYQMNIIPYLVDKTNKSNGVIITFVDITDRIRVLKDLERLIATHETFIYSVSHDLKGPLSNIEGLVNDLINTAGPTTEWNEEALEDHKLTNSLLLESIASMRNVINELSEIIKIESNFKEKVELVKIENLINQVKLVVRDAIHESKAIIHVDIQVPKIKFSRKNLRSILYNLLSNAIKYRIPNTPPIIHLKIEKAEGFTHISVKDNGRGMDEAKQKLIFTPYTRLVKDVEGTGIGLYFVKKIIENEGGRITFKSRPGEGSEFNIYLKS
ncbi:sensor histidine kinase [Cyclobacterium roseum]|uniref:sensor histidine kinase n=1 Tax=Cyclobacterium roseum TaxID=2666137 RepID=UPI0013916E0B|nr:ATP-binding protein [Cyclobacterium roseum]